MSTEPHFTFKFVDVDNDKVVTAKDIIRRLYENKNNSPAQIARQLKQTFDSKYGSTWHCVVGNSFGTFVTHLREHFLYFYVDNHAILLFKTPFGRLKDREKTEKKIPTKNG